METVCFINTFYFQSTLHENASDRSSKAEVMQDEFKVSYQESVFRIIFEKKNIPGPFLQKSSHMESFARILRIRFLRFGLAPAVLYL